ncbi:MAG: MBL fold metallo-hydrolase [Phycisphaerales bacterium]|nr:MBL fold metallo-hydrolase [Phycisphaerales bacterium]
MGRLIDRREFLCRAAALGAAAAVIPGVLGEPTGREGATPPAAGDKQVPTPAATKPDAARLFFEFRELRPGVLAVLGRGGDTTLGGNNLLVWRPGLTVGGVLIDARHAWLGPTLRRECAAFNAVNHVINTHHHADHTGGNHAFRDMAPIYMHPNARPRVLGMRDTNVRGLGAGAAAAARVKDAPLDDLLRDLDELKGRAEQLTPEDFAPGDAQLMDKPFEAMRLNEVRVEVLHHGPAHTDNDLIVWLPQVNVLHTGDLVFHGLHAFLDRPGGGTVRGWIKVLDKLGTLGDRDTIVVPGHGEPGDRSMIARQGEYLRGLLEFVEKQRAAGTPRDEIVKMVPEGAGSLGLARVLPVTLGAVYDELSGPVE